MHDERDARELVAAADADRKLMDIEQYRCYIEAALAYSYGTHTYEDVARMVQEGSLQFWPGVASVILTEIIEHPRRRVLNVFLAGGKLDEIERMIPPLQDWARSRGCTLAVFAGRQGWERTFLAKDGWTPRVWMAKEI